MHPVDKRVWRYDLESINGSGWATVLLTGDGGLFAVSDWGNYAYRWTSHGCRDFREFLLDPLRKQDYLLSKLCERKQYNAERTIAAVRAALKEGVIDSTDQRRAEYELIKDGLLDSEAGFLSWCGQTSICEPHDYRVEDYSPQAVSFVRETLVRLAPLLKADLEASDQSVLSGYPEARIALLRRWLLAAGRAAGGILADTVTDEFLSQVPKEIEMVLAKARCEGMRAENMAQDRIRSIIRTQSKAGCCPAGVEQVRQEGVIHGLNLAMQAMVGIAAGQAASKESALRKELWALTSELAPLRLRCADLISAIGVATISIGSERLSKCVEECKRSLNV